MSCCKHLQQAQFGIPGGGLRSPGGFRGQRSGSQALLHRQTVYSLPLAAGNAGMAAAYAARKLGIPATIVVPCTTPALTIERLKGEGATVKVVGEVSAARGREGSWW